MKKKTIKIAVISSLCCVLAASAGYISYKNYFEPAANEAVYDDLRDDYENGKMNFQKKKNNDDQSNSSSSDDNKSIANNDNKSKNDDSSKKDTENNSSNSDNTGAYNNYSEPISYTYEYEDRVIGWINIPDTSINYPVLYLEGDNEYYLTHDYTNSYNYYGSIYLDGHQYIGAKNMTLFGHNINSYYNAMFREIPNFEYQNYFDNHPTVYFDLGDESSEYEVIGCLVVDLNKNTYDYNRCNFTEGGDFVDFANNLLDHCTVKKSGVTITEDDQLLTLSTCSYHTANGRTILICRKAK